MNQTSERFLRGSALCCALIGLLLSACTSMAPVAGTAAAPVPLWPAGTPGGPGSADADQPALTPFLPKAQATGAAMVIVPSEAGAANASAGEAVEMARWLNQHGIAGFVLNRRGAVPAAVTDVNRAVQHLRAHAAEFNISPKRIAVLGFAAGAQVAAEAAYAASAEGKTADAEGKFSSRPDLLALIWGSTVPSAVPAGAPPTFLIGSTKTGDGMTNTIELWNKLRAARVSVDAHFFAKADAKAGLGGDHPSLSTWPDLLYRWGRFNSWLADEPRLAVKGMVYLDGNTLPHGYVIFTPVDFVGAGPIVGRVLNSTAGQPLGLFTIPKDQGPVAGRYKVEVVQTMNRWLSNSFSGPLVGGRGPATPERTYFGHHRVLSPSIEDVRVYTKSRPSDKENLIVEFKAEGENSIDLKIESGRPVPAPTPAAPNAPAIGGILGGPQNPGQQAYVDQIKLAGPGPVPGIPEPILLWPNGAPEAIPDDKGVFADEDKPAVYAFPASANNNTGAAYLVIAGGAFSNRCMDNEGVQVAKFLNRNGISAFVLRYRISPNYPSRTISTMDGQRGLRFIRANAAKYGISPDLVGIIGFSAGAELQVDAWYNSIGEANASATDPIDRVSARANFSALIYGGRTNLPKPGEAPPTFLFNTVEDGGHLTPEVAVMNGLRGAGVPVEAHFYQVGPHGTSMSPGDPQLGLWPELMVKWMKVSGYLNKSASGR